MKNMRQGYSKGNKRDKRWRAEIELLSQKAHTPVISSQMEKDFMARSLKVNL